ncbi:hypothetical protein LTR86_010383 [Recurvomyces mirabilis]|nr:hypothetical protein LTR86_010383 [Recurvomyces mirabilis]
MVQHRIGKQQTRAPGGGIGGQQASSRRPSAARTSFPPCNQDGNLDKALEILQNSQKIIVVSGAGISISAGMPPLKGRDGIEDYLFEKRMYTIDRERWYKKMLELSETARRVEPTEFHTMLENLGPRLHQHVTQNIDGLDTKTPQLKERTIALHGRLKDLRCTKNPWHESNWDEATLGKSCAMCSATYGLVEGSEIRNPGRLAKSDGKMRPDIVLRGEAVYEDMGEQLIECLEKDFDLLVVVGTSLKIPSCYRFVSELSAGVQGRGGHVIRIDTRLANKQERKIVNMDLKVTADEFARQYSSRLLESGS